jgi:hypothetical protein
MSVVKMKHVANYSRHAHNHHERTAVSLNGLMAEPRFARRRNVFIAGKKPAICGDLKAPTVESASYVSSRLAAHGKIVNDARLNGEIV